MSLTKRGDTFFIRGVHYKVVGIGPTSNQTEDFGHRTYILRMLGTLLLFKTRGREVTKDSVLLPHENLTDPDA